MNTTHTLARSPVGRAGDRRTMKKAVIGAMASLALTSACGGSAVRDATESGGGGDTSGAGDVGTAAAPLQVDLRLRATGIDRFANLMVLPQSVKVSADGVQVPVELVDAPVDLAVADQATKVASFQVPSEAASVEVSVELAPAGVFEAVDGIGWLDMRSTSLHFKSSAANLAEKGKAVMILDANRSLVALGENELGLVPNFKVRF